MKTIRWAGFAALMFIQGILAGPGAGAESARDASAASADAKEPRVAVVIGNSAYTQGLLPNPRNDAKAMAAALRKLGFDVELKLDASKADMNELFRRFSRKAETAAVAALFYAGHGVQVNGGNYIVPVDAAPQSERDVKRELVKMEDIIDDMGEARVKLVFFDACRDNPLSRSFSRGGSRGMAAPVEATGTLISFATKHGNTAADGDGDHSPYTAALLAALEKPAGLEIEQLLRKVQQGVKQSTQGQQEPWRYGSLDGEFYFKAVDPAEAAKAQQESVDRAVSEALRRANEQAARERAELQQSIKAQQEATDRAVAEAVRRSNEQAVRERAELQATMDRLLKEALARQNELLEAQRAARDAADARAARPSPSEPGPAKVAAAAAADAVPAKAPEPAKSVLPERVPAAAPPPAKPVQGAAAAPIASVAPSPSPVDRLPAGDLPAPGDEWEYVTKDVRFGGTNTFVERVKAVVDGSGVLEEFMLDGQPAGDWVFSGKPSLITVGFGTGVMFTSHWTGNDLRNLDVTWARCSRDLRCTASAEMAGSERITVPAGSFETKKINIAMGLGGFLGTGRGSMTITVWYSEAHHRVIRQRLVAQGFNGRMNANEILELAAVRAADRSRLAAQ